MTMQISEQYAWIPEKKQRENSPLLPNSLRAVIVGKSGCGKTTLLINLLLRPEWLDYNHLYMGLRKDFLKNSYPLYSKNKKH